MGLYPAPYLLPHFLINIFMTKSAILKMGQKCRKYRICMRILGMSALLMNASLRNTGGLGGKRSIAFLVFKH